MMHNSESDMDEKDMAAMDHDKMIKGQAKIPHFSIELSLDDFQELKGDDVGDEIVLCIKGKVESVGKDSISAGFDVASVVHGNMPDSGPGEKHKRLEEILGEKKKMSTMGRKY